MKFAFLGFFFFLALSCNTLKKDKVEPSQPASIGEIMPIIEKDLFMSCPISKGPNHVMAYLEGIPSFVRNKEYDRGNGSVRFNAKGATFFGAALIDEKSLFLLNYRTESPNEKLTLFQAIYFFKNEADKKVNYQRILDLLTKDLNLTYDGKHDLANNLYLRFYLPDGSAFNLKQTPDKSDKHVIDILWVPSAK